MTETEILNNTFFAFYRFFGEHFIVLFSLAFVLTIVFALIFIVKK